MVLFTPVLPSFPKHIVLQALLNEPVWFIGLCLSGPKLIGLKPSIPEIAFTSCHVNDSLMHYHVGIILYTLKWQPIYAVDEWIL